MRAVIQQHSFLLAAVMLLLALGFLLLGAGFRPRRAAALLAVAAGLAAFYFALRPAPAPFASAAAVEQALRDGRPTVLEVYSDL